jgi:hypothetical protein
MMELLFHSTIKYLSVYWGGMIDVVEMIKKIKKSIFFSHVFVRNN